MLVPILLNSHPGTKYGIPFPVFARAAYGTRGANLPALMRALVACGWFGINAWIGGKALQTFFTSLWPGWDDALGRARRLSLHDRSGSRSSLFWGLNILVIFRGMELLRRVERWAAPFVLVMTALLVVVGDRSRRRPRADPRRSVEQAVDGADVLRRLHARRSPAMIGFWATLSLNMPDFTRFGRSQREQAIGQVVALPTTMTVFAAMGIVITSATAVIYGKAIWDPIELARHVRQLAVDRRDRDVHGRRRDARGEHRRQRGVAGERLRERVPEAHPTSSAAGSSPA